MLFNLMPIYNPFYHSLFPFFFPVKIVGSTIYFTNVLTTYKISSKAQHSSLSNFDLHVSRLMPRKLDKMISFAAENIKNYDVQSFFLNLNLCLADQKCQNSYFDLNFLY